MRKHSLLLTSALALLATSAPFAVAQAPVPAAPAAPASKPDEASRGSATKSKDSVSVDYPDEDIRNILRNVADLFELNLVMPETLQGKTTLKLRDVTWRQIFQSVLSPVGYNYIEEGNIIKIVSNESLQQEPTSTEVFILNYARAADIMPTLASLVDPAAGGKIVVDARSNSLVITERPSRMNRVRPIIDKLDKATDQVMIETKFIEVTDSDVKNVGVNWASLGGYNIGASPAGSFNRTQTQNRSVGGTTTNTSSSGTNSSTTNSGSPGTTSSSSVTSNGGLLTFDPNTNLPTVTAIPPVTNTTTTITGPTSTTTVTSGSTGLSSDALNLLNSVTDGSTTARALSAVFSADQFRLVLSALQSLQSTKVVSNPTVVTLNNTEATINVGESRPIPNYTFNQQTGTYEVSGFQYRDIGVNLKVTPQVNAQGFIKLTVEPDVSQSTRDAVFNGAGIPIIDQRKAKTQVSLKDGSTMGIGGLLRKSTGNSTNKVPVLGSVPVVGRLFRSNAKNEQTTNLLIFITARLVPADGGQVEQVFDPRTIRQMGIRRDELPGQRDGSDPFAAVPVPTPDTKVAKAIAKTDSPVSE